MIKTHRSKAVEMRDAQILSALPAFEAAARLGSFTKAAKELGLTQSALSRRVQSLEDGLGVALFSRRGRTVVITGNGRQLAAAAAEALHLVEATRLALGGSLAGTIRIGTLPSFGSLWLAPRLMDFTSRYPEAALSVTTIAADFSGEHKDPVDWDPSKLDVVLTLGRGGWRSLAVRPLFRETMVAVCTPECARRHDLRSPDDLWRMPRLAHETRSNPWAGYARHLGAPIPRPGATPVVAFEHFFLILEAARAGLGVALIPEAFVTGDIAAQRLVAPFAPWATGATYAAVSSRTAAHRPIVSAFTQWLTDQAQDGPASRTPPISGPTD